MMNHELVLGLAIGFVLGTVVVFWVHLFLGHLGKR